jgi:hypothetical protein
MKIYESYIFLSMYMPLPPDASVYIFPVLDQFFKWFSAFDLSGPEAKATNKP